LSASPTKARTLWLALLVIILNASGNLSLTVGMRSLPDKMSANPLDFIRAMFHPMVALGIVLLILWLLTRMTLFSWADLSFVVPVTAVGYILATIVGHFFLGERVTPTNWLGTFLIFFGTAFVGTTKPLTTECGRDAS
jgi:drug/metabolite transporter (DMT)-like permease